MNRTLVTFLIAAAAALPLGAQHRGKEVVAYYPSWKWRTDTHLLAPAAIPFGKITIINYAFFYPLPDGVITGRDSSGDALILSPPPVSGDSKSPSSGSLTALAHRHRVKVLMSIGGWEDSDNFPAVAADSARTARFARSCADRIREFGFDGIDIDWEFPGLAEHRGTPADGKNFVRLLRVLRDRLDLLGAHAGRHMFLTAALPAERGAADRMEIKLAAPVLDFLNVMTYDLYGTWEPGAYHNAPLYAGPGHDSARSVDGAFRLYHDFYGIRADRINLGVPFYGHSFTECTELDGPHGPADTVHFPSAGTFYYRIAGQMQNFTRHWDSYAMVPYLISAQWRMFVSYDDEESVRRKAQYVLDRGARGLIIWEITGDYLPDGSHPLLDAIDGVFHGSH